MPQQPPTKKEKSKRMWILLGTYEFNSSIYLQSLDNVFGKLSGWAYFIIQDWVLFGKYVAIRWHKWIGLFGDAEIENNLHIFEITVQT